MGQIYIQGILLGFAYVAPIGMQNIFIINRALPADLRRALTAAVSVTFFDILLSSACFFGVGNVLYLYPQAGHIILGAGSCFIIFIAVSLLRARDIPAADSRLPSGKKTVVTAFLVTWVNPQALIDGTMLLGAFRASFPGDAGLAFMGGVLSASVFWFFGITAAVRFFGNFITPRLLRLLNIVCGLVILFYGIRLAVLFVQSVFFP